MKSGKAYEVSVYLAISKHLPWNSAFKGLSSVEMEKWWRKMNCKRHLSRYTYKVVSQTCVGNEEKHDNTKQGYFSSAEIRWCRPTNMGWPKLSGLRNYRFIINSKHNLPWVTHGYEPSACIKRNPMVHNHAHNRPQLVSTIRQTNPFHPLPISDLF